MKKMQDYIHLYIGQNVVHVPDDKTTANIHGLDLSAGRVFVNNNDHQMYGELKLSEIKLILRPLESMTDEDKRDFIMADDFYLDHWVEIGDWVYDGIFFKIQYNGKGRQYSKCMRPAKSNPDQYRWLLQKGFDLFGLKEAGLAIYG